MPWKIQPIKVQESRCIVDGITPNLPIVRCAYVNLFVLATVFSMAWYKIENSYRKLSRGIPWNIPLITCIFLVYTLA
jgi:hypothetical protein